jgi:hypothetical protein
VVGHDGNNNNNKEKERKEEKTKEKEKLICKSSFFGRTKGARENDIIHFTRFFFFFFFLFSLK